MHWIGEGFKKIAEAIASLFGPKKHENIYEKEFGTDEEMLTQDWKNILGDISSNNQELGSIYDDFEKATTHIHLMEKEIKELSNEIHDYKKKM